MSHRTVVAPLVLLLSGCAAQRGPVSVESRAIGSAPIHGCYVGAAFLFADSTVNDGVRRDVSQWLVLDPPSAEADPVHGFNGRVVLSSSRPPYRATWWLRGDSVHVTQQTFPASYWVFAPTTAGLVGRAVFRSDMVRVGSDGRPVPERTDWPARLQRVDCDLVPKPVLQAPNDTLQPHPAARDPWTALGNAGTFKPGRARS